MDRVIGVRWGLSSHASSSNLLTALKKLQGVLNFGHLTKFDKLLGHDKDNRSISRKCKSDLYFPSENCYILRES